MSESEPPRITITLPEGRVFTGRLLRWRQGPDGRWWAEVAQYVPAGAVGKVDGEDYSAVPREPAGPQFVLSTDTRLKPPRMVLHLTTCWTLQDPAAWRRLTPVRDADQARGMLQFPDDTTACDTCHPEPRRERAPPRRGRCGAAGRPLGGMATLRASGRGDHRQNRPGSGGVGDNQGGYLLPQQIIQSLL